MIPADFRWSLQPLRACVVFIGTSVLLAAGPSGGYAQSAGPTTTTKQIITLDGANTIVSPAVVHAKNMGELEVIAVSDSTGLPKALASVDRARVTSVNTAFERRGWPRAVRLQHRIWQMPWPANRRSTHRAS